jgi:mannose-6-phosphate isomerase
LIFAENDRYAGKILHLDAGQALSLQYHERKDETLYVLSGQLKLEVGQNGALRELTLAPGEAFRIVPGMRHRMSADIATELVEVSSPEIDDVVRLEDRYGRAGTTAP